MKMDTTGLKLMSDTTSENKIEKDSMSLISGTNSTFYVNQFKNESFQSYTLCEQKNTKTTCYMIPIYIAKGNLINCANAF